MLTSALTGRLASRVNKGRVSKDASYQRNICQGTSACSREGFCFDMMNEEKSKRTHNNARSSAPKRLKSVDNRALGRTKEDLKDYL
ncbi:hypothetical protein ACSBR2_029784 [Camellia fascicularis]